MVDQLLDLARFNYSTKVEPQNIALADFAAVVMDAFQSAIILQRHEVELDINRDIVVLVEADALETILVNLISNAIKYTSTEGEIKLSATQTKNEVTLMISDTGIGIDEQDLDDVFKPFVRGRQQDETITGTGLGLALVKELVVAHKGKIWLESTLGRGCKFFVVLPLGKSALITSHKRTLDVEALQSMLPQTEQSTVVAQMAAKTKTAQLLIIEDHPQMLDYLHSLFVDDYDCLLANNGKEGLLLACEQIPDLILSDVMMPKIDGIALTRRLKQDIKTSHIPIVLLTAKGDIDARVEGLTALANDYITKPFDDDELKLKLDNLLRFRALLVSHLAQHRPADGENTEVVDIALNSTEQAFKNRLDEIIDKGYQEQVFTVQDIAKALFVTNKQLQRKLKGVFGLTPTEYLRDYRLVKAAQLLREGARPFDAAELVGFGAYTYFSTCFAKMFGLSPKQYQQQY